MLSPELATYSTILVYLGASVAGTIGLIWHKKPWLRYARWLALAAFACQTIVLVFGFHRSLPAGPSLGAYMQLLAWFFLLFGIGAWLWAKKDTLLLFAAPVGLFLFLLSTPWLHSSLILPPSLSRSFFALHIGSLFLALGLLTLAFLSSCLFIFLERRLKAKKHLQGIWSEMPALTTLEKINSFCALVCYPLYTIGIIAGICWAKPVFASNMNGDIKELVSLFVWLLLTILFYNRVARAWKGRKPAIMIIAIFLLSFLSIVLVNLYLPTYHGFARS